MKRRAFSDGGGCRLEERMPSKTWRTCWGSGSALMILSYGFISATIIKDSMRSEEVWCWNQRIGYNFCINQTREVHKTSPT